MSYIPKHMAEPKVLGVVVEDRRGERYMLTAKGWMWLKAAGPYHNGKSWNDADEPLDRNCRVVSNPC